MAIPLTPWKRHCEHWSEGCGSGLCLRRNTRIVLGKGKLPAEVLFVGEAPGESENVLGLPFVGPAGKLLDSIVDRAGLSSYRLAFTNLTGCIPREEDGSKASEPLPDEVDACSGRLKEFVQLADGSNKTLRFIVCVGAMARDYLSPGYQSSIKLHRSIPMIEIKHPAAILRGQLAQRGLSVQKCVVTLADAAERFLSQGGR